jgi:aminoglycoside 3-N-acetyltransferase
MSRPADYGLQDVVRAFGEVGLRDGDIAFTHAGVAMLGRPDVGLDRAAIGALFLEAFRAATGGAGTWVLPTYTYSYTRREPFDPAATPPTSDMGALSQALWQHPDAVRSLDPIFSVVAIGPRAHELTDGVDACFGPDCVYARLLAADAAMLNIGIGSHSALLHHVEQTDGVPYRFLKRFEGVTVVDGEERPTAVDYNVRALDEPRHDAYFLRLDRDGRDDGSVRAARLGRGEVNLVRASRMAALARAGLARDPEYLVLGDRAEADG